jgi:hypothetical protein
MCGGSVPDGGCAPNAFEVEGDRGRLELKVALEPGTGAVTAAALLIRKGEAPPEGW